MSDVDRTTVERALRDFVEPHLGQDLLTAKAVKELAVDGGKVRLRVALGFPARLYGRSLTEALRSRIEALPGVTGVEIEVDARIISHEVQKG
ncbi:MAG: iron-sulfur cluster assembly protein, partial [Candidatus Competibacterales bacterium]|nr:iron-sulfur cluster assembly protein [Candidatus Competibacterales bacterium]